MKHHTSKGIFNILKENNNNGQPSTWANEGEEWLLEKVEQFFPKKVSLTNHTEVSPKGWRAIEKFVKEKNDA